MSQEFKRFAKFLAVGITGFIVDFGVLNFLLRVLLEMCFLKAMCFADEQVRRLAERCGAYQKEARWLFRAAATTPKTTDRQGEDA